MKTLPLLVIALLLPACTDSPSGEPAYHATLNVTVAPSAAWPGNPATITADAINDGMSSYRRMEGCSYWGRGMGLQIIDPQHREVFLSNPLLRPKCADHSVDFPPGERLTSSARFEGTLFDAAGHQFAALEGTYTVTVSFLIMRGGEMPMNQLLKESATFTWRPM